MKKFLTQFVAAFLVLAFAATGAVEAGDSVSIRLKDGSRWRGQVDDQVHVTYLQHRNEVAFAGKLVKVRDLYVVIEGNVAGELREKTIFRDDIVTMRTVGDEDGARSPTKRTRTTDRARDWKSSKKASSMTDDTRRPCVFVLPLEGGVGQEFRRDEIKMMGEHADKFGDGQIIVLLIDSNGGSALESQYIAEEIFEIRKRHRVVAWIRKAISAGCQTAMCCEEIYFMTEGSAGAVTTWNPGSGQSIKGQDLIDSMEHLAEIAERSGYSPYIAYAMKTNSAMCSYTKDPETGEVTFYDDLSGEVVLSDADSNLSFTSSTALDCGFSKGTADTTDDLAKLLDLEEWYETDDYGRKIAKKWQELYTRASEEIQRLWNSRGYAGTGGDAVERLGRLIRINQDLLRWAERAPQAAGGLASPQAKNQIQREIEEYRKQLADIRRAQRRR